MTRLWPGGAWLDIPDPAELEALTRDRLPLGLGTPSVTRDLFRDIYYDTPDATLRHRGVRFRLRHGLDGRQTLSAWLEGRDADSRRRDLDITGQRLDDVLRSSAAPVGLVRAVADPAGLGPVLEARIERHVRQARWLSLPWIGCQVAVDRTSVWSEDRGIDLADVAVRPASAVGPSAGRIAAALARRHRLRPIVVDPLQRMWNALETGDALALTSALHAPRECAVLLVRGGQVGLRREGGQLGVFWGAGGGEQGCRAVLGQAFGSAQGQVRCLGQASSRPWRRPLEVWMARRLPPGVATDPAVEWVTFDRAVELAGTPLLRDARALSALHVAAQSDLLREQTTLTRRASAALRPAAAPVRPEDGAARYLDADVSQLDFNARVLELAADDTLPPAVRAGYLAIAASNLDEFFMVRIGALKRAASRAAERDLVEAGEWSARLDGARLKARALHEDMYDCLVNSLVPALVADGTRVRRWAELSADEQGPLTRRFHQEIRPRLVPLAATSHHPFPHVGNTELSLAVLLREPGAEQTRLATVTVPASLPRFLALETTGEWMAVEADICAHVGSLFPGSHVVRAHSFRVTRSADIRYEESTGTDALQLVADAIERRPFLPVVRLEVEEAMPPDLRALLLQEFRFEMPDRISDLDAGDVVEVRGLAGLRSLRDLSNAVHGRLPLPERSPFPAAVALFEHIRSQDVLVHFPYDAFGATVLRFLDEAAADPAVELVVLTLYRTSERSPVIDALFRARASGKSVIVLVELKARFDEARNIESARAMRAAGIQVVYGVPEMKLHAKLVLVLRREEHALRRYVYVGSGNFNPVTAGLYTDVGLFTAREVVSAEVAALVDSLTGLSRPPEFFELLVSPAYMLPRLIEMIRREAEHARAGRPAGIRAKLNGLDDPELVEALYEASGAGVPIDLVVRGICTLRPGVAGMSDRIRVVSVLGEFLEHARIVHFVDGGQGVYFVGSADWRERNLRRRVEVYAPVVDAISRSRLDHLLQIHLGDPGAWHLGPDGRWGRRATADHPGGSQRRLIAEVDRPAGEEAARPIPPGPGSPRP